MRLAALLAAAMFCSGAWAAESSCGFDLAAAREAALAAGPVRSVEHFTTSDGGPISRSLTIVIDLVRPDRMRRISIFEDGKVGQMVLIAGSGWSGNLERGWEPLDARFSTDMLAAVMKNSPWPDVAAEVLCSLVGEEGTSAARFSFSENKGGETTDHEVLVDPDTRLPIRYRAHRSLNGGPYTASDRTFHFISALAIEAP
jgi:hypothetical protein